jgi:hypothetical protein
MLKAYHAELDISLDHLHKFINDLQSGFYCFGMEQVRCALGYST